MSTYNTPYMMFWKNASRQVKANWKDESEEIVKRKTNTPVIAVATAIVPFRPMYLISTVQQAIKDPGTPTIAVMASTQTV
jgi:hypothetical protein